MQRELTLHELLTEPIVRKLMKADGVMISDILKLYRPEQFDDQTVPAYICDRMHEACLEQA